MCVSQGFLAYTDPVLSSLTTVMSGTGTRFKDLCLYWQESESGHFLPSYA